MGVLVSLNPPAFWGWDASDRSMVLLVVSSWVDFR
jgi:hypothetical protein